MRLQTLFGEYEITLAREEHVSLLPEVEHQAAQMYRGHGIADEIIDGVSEVDALYDAMRAGLLWVALEASGQPVGFAFVEELEGGLYLSELDVLPTHGRRGIGRALVHALCDFAHEQQKSVTLSTFSDIPWNAPFYKTEGFAVVSPEDFTDWLKALKRLEARRGLPMERRVIMKKAFVEKTLPRG